MTAEPTNYIDFLRAKAVLAPSCGLPCDPAAIHPILFSHQRDIACWAVEKGRAAIFAAFGMGKTLIQCEIQRQISAHVGGRHLIVAPLGVRQEFRRDAQLLGMEYCFVRRTEEVGGDGFYLTNYESIRDGKLDPDLFISVSLDEASCLRSFGSETYQAFLSLFQETPYRFVATATPSPNRYKELLHYAAFLGIMDSGQGLTRFFQRDSTKANNLTLYPHMEEEFFAFLHSWAIFLQRPSDLGYSDDGYDLPELKVHYHEIPTPRLGGDFERDGQGQLLQDAALGLQEASREKRGSIDERIGKMMEIINSEPCEWCGGMGTIESPSCCFVTCTECKGTKMHPASNFILWHDLEAERHAIQKALPEAMAVYGTLDLDEREARIIAFSNGKTQFLSTKPEISGSGCNFQRHCHKAIFLGIGYQFNDFIQSIHRIQRFGQTHPVEIHIIYTETEREVLKTLQRKWAEHDALTARMSELIRAHGLSSTGLEASLQRKVGCERIAVTGERYEVVNADCVEETRRMADASVQMILTSIPFGNHYEYTELFNDFGHNQDNQAFFRQMDFLSPELLRVLEPGRICAIHVKDRIQFGNVTGMGRPTVEPFHSDCIRHYIQHGFAYLGMITVVTDVVRENNQTYRLGYSEMCKDGSKMGVGSPEYVLLFCRLPSDTSKGYADRPVTKSKEEYSLARWQVDASAFWRSSGNRFLTAEELRGLPTGEMVKRFTQHSLETLYDYEEHVRIGEEMGDALPRTFSAISPGSQDPDVWHDVNRMLTLNSEQARKNLVYHICLARGSMVLTRTGYKPIQEVTPGEEVLTHKGRWRHVLAVQNTSVRPVVTVKAQGVPGLTLTPDHKLWARAVRDMPGSKAHARMDAVQNAPDWMEAQKTVGSFINLKLPEVEAPQITDLLHWWTVGRWLACGHMDMRGGAVISCGAQKTEELQAQLGRFGGNPFHIIDTSAQILLKDPGGVLRETLSRCGKGAACKQIPAEAFTLPVEQARALLQGYLAGDGHLNTERSRWMASSVSKNLLLGIAMLAQRVYGAIASIYPGRPARQSVILGRTVNCKQEWVLSFDIPSDSRRGKPFLLEDGAWKKVRSVEEAGEVETWNLRVEEDESFTAEGCIVKNCPLQIDIVARLIGRYSNPGDIIFDPFAGLGTVPATAVRMGRQGRGSELNADYFRDSLRYLRAAEAEAKAPTLFDDLFAEPTGAEAGEVAT